MDRSKPWLRVRRGRYEIGGNGGLGGAQGCEAGLFEVVAVEEVVGVEGDEALSVGVGDVDALEAVLRAAFEHVDVPVFEDDFGVDAAEAGGAEGDGGVVVEERARAGHKVSWLEQL